MGLTTSLAAEAASREFTQDGVSLAPCRDGGRCPPTGGLLSNVRAIVTRQPKYACRTSRPHPSQYEGGAFLRHMDERPDYSEMPFAANKARLSREAR
jgi:hypothetical protein